MATATRIPTKNKLYFLLCFWGGVLGLWGVRQIFPQWADVSLMTQFSTASPVPQVHPIIAQSQRVDSLLRKARTPLSLRDAHDLPLKHPVVSVPSFADAFPDLNDVQLATATRLGIRECANRAEASQRVRELVYIGDSPFYEVKNLTHSIPYLVPRAATLLDKIGRAFLDSCAVKGFPFHKIVVTSVLRTNDDVSRLRRHNQNASEHSCHRFGTTFDISYNHYRRVQDPELPPQTETWAVTLKSILAEVLNDQRRLGTCYIKYEVHQSCFHITAR